MSSSPKLETAFAFTWIENREHLVPSDGNIQISFGPEKKSHGCLSDNKGS